MISHESRSPSRRTHPMNRREFLATSAAGATLAAAQAGERRNLRAGVIGTGWYGMVDCRHLLNESNGAVEVVSLCDVDRNQSRAAADEIERRTRRRPEVFEDFRT